MSNNIILDQVETFGEIIEVLKSSMMHSLPEANKVILDTLSCKNSDEVLLLVKKLKEFQSIEKNSKPFSIGDIQVEIKPQKFKITISVNGIYGECKFVVPLLLPSGCESTSYNISQIINPTLCLPQFDNFKYSYSYYTESEKTGEYVSNLSKDNVPGLPQWLSKGEYYKMCMLQQSQKQNKLNLETKINQINLTSKTIDKVLASLDK
jgi:hypothetical protein